MSKVRGRIAETQLLKQETDIHKRSITPDTHKYRTVLQDQQELQNFITSSFPDKESDVVAANQMDAPSDPFFYVDKYQYQESLSSHVYHFGINIFQQNLDEQLVAHEKRVKEYVAQKQGTQSKGKGKQNAQLEQVIDLQENKKVVTPSEIGSQVSQDKLLKAKEYKEDSKQLLTDFEKAVFQAAVAYLNDNSLQRTVLIDIFARHDKDGVYDKDHAKQEQKYTTGDIKITSEGIRETHTVVLYKQDNKYLVIDPSNPTFSTVLIGADEQVRVCFEPKLKIYKPSGDTGYDTNKWRDCIDVAVKLAFSINKDLPKIGLQTAKNAEITIETINYQSMKEMNSVKDITNQKESYQSLPKLVEANCIRAKQSSDIRESKLVTFFLKKMNNLSLDMKEKLESTKLDPYNLLAKFTLIHESKIVNYKQSHKEYITNIEDYLGSLNSWINKIDNSSIEQLELLAITGDLSNDINEWGV